MESSSPSATGLSSAPSPAPAPAPIFHTTTLTAASQLRTQLLSATSSRATLVTGPCGIGKTSTLLTVLASSQVNAAFGAGVLHVSLAGMRSARAALRRLVPIATTVVPDFAERVKTATTGEDCEIVRLFVRLLSVNDAPSLLVLDDFDGVGADEGVKSIVRILAEETVARNSMFRFIVVASRLNESQIQGWHGCAVVHIGRIDDDPHFSRKLLLEHAGLAEDSELADDSLIDSVIHRCDGHPLALAVAGAAICALTEHAEAEGWGQILAQVFRDAAKDGRATNRAEQILMMGLLCLQMTWSEALPISSEHALLSLCVLRRGDIISVKRFAQMWRLTYHESESIIKKLKDARLLMTIYESDRNCGKWKLYDSVQDFGIALAEQTGNGMATWHRKVVESFRKELPVYDVDANGERLHEWWNGQVEDEKYLSENLIRHLLLSGQLDSSLWLLLDYRWIQYQNSNKDQDPFQAMLCDVKLLQNLLEEEVNLQLSPDRLSTLTGLLADLDVLVEGLKQSSLGCSHSRDECSFQLHGRLSGLQGETTIMEWCVRSIEKFAKCPWVRPMDGMLQRPVFKLKKSFPHERCLDSISLYPSVNGLLVSRKDGQIDVLFSREGFVHKTLSPSHSAGQGNKRQIYLGSSWASKDILSLLRGPEDTILNVWRDGETVQEFRPFSFAAEITCATMIEPTTLACGASNGVIYFLNCCIGQPFREMSTDVELDALTATHDGKTLVSLSSKSGTLQLWDMAQETCKRTLSCGSGSNCVAVSREATFLACGMSSGNIQVYAATDDSELWLLMRHTAPVSCLAFSHDTKYLYSGSLDHSIVIWDLKVGAMRFRYEHRDEPIIGISLGRGGHEIYCASEHAINILTARPVLSTNDDYAMDSALRNEVQAYCLSASSNTLVTAESDRVCFRDARGPNTFYEALQNCSLHNVREYDEIRIAVHGRFHTTDCIAISPDENLIAYALRMVDIGSVQVYVVDRSTGNTVLVDDAFTYSPFKDKDGFLGCKAETLSFVFHGDYLKACIRFDFFNEQSASDGMDHERIEVMWDINGTIVYSEQVAPDFLQDFTQVLPIVNDSQDDSACLHMVDRHHVLIDRPEVKVVATLPKGAMPILATLGTTERPELSAVSFMRRTGRLWILNEDSGLQYVDLIQSKVDSDGVPPLPIPRIVDMDCRI